MIKVPKGCPVQEKIIVRDKGFPSLRGRGRGNLIVVTQCHIPKRLSAEAKEQLKKYSQEIGTSVNDDEGTISGFFKTVFGIDFFNSI